MNKGVEILLARMETHPEEFEQDSKWVGMFNEYKKYMEPEEQTAVLDKLKQLKMDKFEELIVKRLMREELEQEPIQKDMFGNSSSPYAISSLPDYQVEELKKMLVEKLARIDK
jgi:hypothetical protein